jgi:hypothetical protein
MSARIRGLTTKCPSVPALSHPHICALYDIGEEQGTSFLVMEHLEGQTLADRLAKGALPIDRNAGRVVHPNRFDVLWAPNRLARVAGARCRQFRADRAPYTARGKESMNPVLAAALLPFIVAGGLGLWALAIMYFERRKSRKRPQ